MPPQRSPRNDAPFLFSSLVLCFVPQKECSPSHTRSQIEVPKDLVNAPIVEAYNDAVIHHMKQTATVTTNPNGGGGPIREKVSVMLVGVVRTSTRAFPVIATVSRGSDRSDGLFR